jgi:(1->4)-alpha-D-glucan 1-alpha-D-glucosylmutase
LTLATRLPRGLELSGGWQDTAIQLDSAMTDELTGRAYGPGRVAAAEILRDYPVALLTPVA